MRLALIIAAIWLAVAIPTALVAGRWMRDVSDDLDRLSPDIPQHTNKDTT